MPDEINIGTDVKAALDRLQHYALKNHTSRTQNYTKILSTLENGEDLNLTETERLLAICVHDLKEDMRYTATIMKIISVILSRVQMGRYNLKPNLLPSALAVIYITKTAALKTKVETLHQLCFDTLSSYPNDILISASENHQDVVDIFALYCNSVKYPVRMRLMACSVLYKLLKILPPEKRRQFVEKGLTTWFSRVIPTCMCLEIIEQTLTVELLEVLTEELVEIDCTGNQHWPYILESICNTKKYPAIMKSLLEKGNDFWHRIWILFIRLLKHQVTQTVGNVGSPINSMLPVVEAAFKVDVGNRCKAFQCWSVLIDSFSTETSESNINKRIKLLIIPLKSNNAKHETTALAKFQCWWHLLLKFENKIDKFIDSFLVSFLHFCFGKPNPADNQLIPGQISVAVKKQCVQALVDMIGHVNCDGCTDLPKLNGKLLNTKNLVENWSLWVFSLTSAFTMSANPDSSLTNQQMTCLWKSFLMTIGELPANNIRRDLFSQMLSILILLMKKCETNARYSELVFNALILSLFDGETIIKQLLKTKEKDVNRPLCHVIKVILDPSLKLAYQSCSFKQMVTKLRRVTDMLLDPVYSEPICVVHFILKTLTANDICLTFWTALAESIVFMAQNVACDQVLCETILWPLKSVNEFTHVKVSAMTWNTMYDLLYPKLKYSENFINSISTFLFNVAADSHSTIYFKLSVILCVLRHKMAEQNCSACEKEIEQLHILTSHIDTYQNYEELVPILVDRVVATISIIITNINEAVAQYILLCLKKLINVMTLTCKQQSDVSHILSFIDSLLKSLDSLIQVETYEKFISIVVDELLDCSSYLSQQPLTKNTVFNVLRTLKSKIVDETDITLKKIKALIHENEDGTMTKEKNLTTDKDKFTTPKTKEVPKKIKKKEPNIVSTVVENGEEYVVVKSNWKFNPRKLTETQKEKLQRKREDIPALYQDLSQSQDEFKLVSWKTDSQDTSDSSKSESKSCKSASNETATEILSSIPSSNVVPKILENFFAENIKKDSSVAKDVIPADKKISKTEAVTPKNTKSPRMALKDRVFRNVRHLIENSGVQKENKNASVDLNKTETIIKTPTLSKSDDTANVVNSAPPFLTKDRPSRVKRKPKKFDELLLLTGAKKSRQSLLDPKSKSGSIKSILDTTPLETDSAEDVSPSIESCPNENALNDGDNKVPEIVTCSENTQKDESDITSETGITKEVDLKIVEKNPSCSHLNDDMDIGKNDDIIDEQKVESSFENNTEKPTANKIESSTEKKLESCAEEKVEKSAEKNVESSTENEVESFDDNKTEVSDNKKGEICNDNKPKESNIDGNDLQDNDNKLDSSDIMEETHTNKTSDKSSESETSPNKNDIVEPSTPQQESKNKRTEGTKSTIKKTIRKSRIESELAIDMVEGHPYLKMQTPKRRTRKALESAGTDRRKSLVEKLNKSKSEAKTEKKVKEKNKDIDSSSSNSSLTVDDSQGTEIKDQVSFTQDLPYSDDVIESSQDSSITTISVKSTKKTPKRVPLVTLEKIDVFPDNKTDKIYESQSILESVMAGVLESSTSKQEGKDDSELPLNKTTSEEQSQADLTENMDTEPIEDTAEVVIILDDVPAPMTISSDEAEVGLETQEIAEADTQPTDPNNFMEVDVVNKNMDTSLTVVDITTDEMCDNKKRKSCTLDKSISDNSVNVPEDITITLSESDVVELDKESGASSPSSFEDDAKRKQDFLNNTLEISPIKNMSPERTKKSPSPDTSGDFVVITLSSPVNSNGEPLEKCGSPEVFTEDKVSPDKRDQSPPRGEVTVTSNSPTSSLSLKKTRPQVRAGGRAAQMLGLCCIPDKVQVIVNQEKTEAEEIKKNSTPVTPARRNLRILYNSVSDNDIINEDVDQFLKLRRSLPAVDSSPSGPILKRKLVEIADDATISPASKRKRVSFHDPPVSTTVSVQKYIEPGGVRSPQNSAHKRLERQLRQHTPLKSPKRLDHAFKLDTVLNKAVESFTVTTVVSTPDDTQPLSLDATPIVEIVRASELNDTDPICPDLVDCNDPIDNIAGELSSFAMKSLLVKELVGKVETIGDLAKMTELEVNRLCIKAPKVKVARKVLTDYASKRIENPPCDVMVTMDEAIFDEPLPDSDLKSIDGAALIFPNVLVETEVQTVATPTTSTFVQTETTPTTHTVMQTDESGSKSTADIIKSCLAERQDFVEQVSEHLEDSSIQQITDKLPFSAITDVLMKKITPSDTKTLLNRVLDEQWNNTTEQNHSNKELSFIREYMCDRFNPKDLILFCSEVLKSVYDQPALP